MKQVIGVMTFALLATLAVGCGDKTAKQKTTNALPQQEAPGKFVFDPPQGWETRSVPNLKNKVVVGPTTAGFAANINVVEEAFQGSLNDYVKANLDVMQKMLKRYRLVKQEEFKTTAGLQGARMIVENEQGGKMLRQTFYLFANAGTKYVVTCSALAEGGEKLDAAFETSLKTFRFDK